MPSKRQNSPRSSGAPGPEQETLFPDREARAEAIISPIDTGQRQQVIAATRDCIARASDIYGHDFEMIPVAFDLKGRAAGMYRVRQRPGTIRYNPYLFAKYFADNLVSTVCHEVAHYVTDMLYGLRNIRPHGAEWQAVMRALGVEPVRAAHYDLTGIPVRTQRRHSYYCGCTSHQLTSRRHNQLRRGAARCFCRSCGGELVYRPGAD